jgi:NAD(P)-dependent dehydrogenase (short-subunit alcohol dehydrogenase family)
MTIPEDPLSLRGKVAIITGGGTGIGAETARIFTRHGAAGIVLAARTESDLEAVAAQLETLARDVGNTSLRVLPVRTDVKDEASVVAMVERTMAEFGQIDVLINNAGGTRMGPLEDMPSRGWDAVVGLNMTGPFYCTREAGRHMIAARSGAIVNISSGAGVNWPADAHPGDRRRVGTARNPRQLHRRRRRGIGTGERGMGAGKPRPVLHGEGQRARPARGSVRHRISHPVPEHGGVFIRDGAGVLRRWRRRTGPAARVTAAIWFGP